MNIFSNIVLLLLTLVVMAGIIVVALMVLGFSFPYLGNPISRLIYPPTPTAAFIARRLWIAQSGFRGFIDGLRIDENLRKAVPQGRISPFRTEVKV